MNAGWDFYFCQINDTRASVFVDLSLRDSAPDPDRPWRLWLWVEQPDSGPDGLGTSEDARHMHRMEKRLQAACRKSKAVYVGRIRRSGRWEFYFYATKPDGFAELMDKLMLEFPERRYVAEQEQDPGWLYYLNVLYPNAAGRQQIHNRREVDKLRDQGDELVAARPVQHWLMFATKDKREEFIRQARAENFQVKELFTREPADDGRPFGLRIEREDYVDCQTIDEVVSNLIHKAESLDGDYTGWEATIVKAEA